MGYTSSARSWRARLASHVSVSSAQRSEHREGQLHLGFVPQCSGAGGWVSTRRLSLVAKAQGELSNRVHCLETGRNPINYTVSRVLEMFMVSAERTNAQISLPDAAQMNKTLF